MQSYSEIECAFLTEDFSIEEFLRACSFLKGKGFGLNCQSPGYVCGEDFEYPEWTTLEQAFEQIKNGGYESCGINLCLSEREDVFFKKLSLEADAETKSICIKVGEEAFVDQESKQVSRSAFLSFANLSQELASLIDVKAWKIAQTGFEYNLGGRSVFISYVAGSPYPVSDLDNTIAWYESEYLTRWQ